jgi:hypothetical protein
MDYINIINDKTFKNAEIVDITTYTNINIETEKICAQGEKESQVIKLIIILMIFGLFCLFLLPRLFRIKRYIVKLSTTSISRHQNSEDK